MVWLCHCCALTQEAARQPNPECNPTLAIAGPGPRDLICCIVAAQESMRLKPAVASGTMRVTLRDVVLGGGKFTVPAGTGLWTPNYPIHNSKLNWGQDAHDYRPVSRHARSMVVI